MEPDLSGSGDHGREPQIEENAMTFKRRLCVLGTMVVGGVFFWSRSGSCLVWSCCIWAMELNFHCPFGFFIVLQRGSMSCSFCPAGLYFCYLLYRGFELRLDSSSI